MLREMRIRELGVIQDAHVELSPGLNVLTGETGAGKTMVVSGLGLLLGRRADAGLVRAGAAAALVEGIVDLPAGHPGLGLAEAAGADPQDLNDGLVLARTVGADGRSRVHISGRSAPVSTLAELGELVVAVHGQADQWRLRKPEAHRDLLDGYGGTELVRLRARYAEGYAALTRLREDLARIQPAGEADLLRAETVRELIAEVTELDPQQGEQAALVAEEDRLAHAESLLLAAVRARQSLLGADASVGQHSGGFAGDTGRFAGSGALELLRHARTTLSAVAEHDPALAALDARCDELGYLLADIASDLAGYLDTVEADPARLEWVQSRRAHLARLARRLGIDLDDTADWLTAAHRELAEIEGKDQRAAQLRDAIEAARRDLGECAHDLSQNRQEAASALAGAVQSELGHLAMGAARLNVQVSQRSQDDGLNVPGHLGPVRFGSHGIDDVDIQLAANPGAPPRSVTRATSGGELSRVMLALEVVAGAADVPTFVFDEVDAGVGGRAALDLGARLAALAEHSQVIVVTHLAQVAAFADRHFAIEKASDGQVTASGIRILNDEERQQELARMMAGVEGSAALGHAADLRAHAQRTAATHAARAGSTRRAPGAHGASLARA